MKKSKNRPPTKKHIQKPTPPLPTISLRTEELKLLKAMSNKRRLNVNGYSDKHKIPRSTTRTRLKKLDRLGLINDKEAQKIITKKGLIYLENTNQIEKGGVGSLRRGGRKNDLSTHWHKFTLPIKERTKFRIQALNRLNPEAEPKENKLRNLHQIIAKFNDATITINPKQVIINLFDVITKDVDSSDIKCLDRAVEYAEKLKSIGIETEGLMVEKGHWARINSQLSEFLEKIDERYFLELEDGSRFWIDHSPNEFGNRKVEDETDSKIVRKNVDIALNEIGMGKVDLTDINKIKESLGFITKLESVRLQDKIEENKLERLKLENKVTTIQDIKLSYIN